MFPSLLLHWLKPCFRCSFLSQDFSKIGSQSDQQGNQAQPQVVKAEPDVAEVHGWHKGTHSVVLYFLITLLWSWCCINRQMCLLYLYFQGWQKMTGARFKGWGSSSQTAEWLKPYFLQISTSQSLFSLFTIIQDPPCLLPKFHFLTLCECNGILLVA